jgi:hypothetical protein
MSNEDERTLTETDIHTAVEKVAGGRTNIIMDSQILTGLMECPRKMDFRFNMNLQSIKGKSNSLECGSIVHKYLEVFNICVINGMDREKAHAFGMTAAETYIRGCEFCTGFTPHRCECVVDDVINPSCIECNGTGLIKKPKCGHRVDDFPGVKSTPVESEGYKTGWKWVLQTCEEYHEYYKNDYWVPLEVEVVKQRILYEDDEIRILWKAKLDLTADTNQGIYPIDHKTMKQRRSQTSLNNQFMGQCLMMNTRSVIIDKVGFQTTLKPQEKFERPMVSYSGERLTEWYSDTLPFWAKMMIMFADVGHFPPNYTNCEGKYGPCAFKYVCESDPDMREEELKQGFIVGPKWNPTNDEDGE